MEKSVEKKVAEQSKVNPDEIRKAELNRIREIEAIGSTHNRKDLSEKSIRDGHSVAEFKGLILDKIGNEKPLEQESHNLDLNAKEKREYSLFNMINAQASGNWANAGYEKELSQEIEKRIGKSPRGAYVPSDIFKRDLTQGTATAGGHVTPDVHRGDLFIDGLYGDAKIIESGATVLRGLKGDIKIPKLTTKGTVGFVAENSAVSETNQAFAQVTMTQRDLGGFVDISRILINNADPSIEQIVRNDMTKQIALKIDNVAYNGGASNEPNGILQASDVATVSIGTNGGAPTYNTTIDMIKEVALENALSGRLAYHFTPEVTYQLRKTPKVSSTDSVMVLDNVNNLNGYPLFQSSELPKTLSKGSASSTLHAGVFGNMADLLIGFYSGLDVLVDNITGATAGTIRLHFFTGVDIAVRHGQSFAKVIDIDETA